MVQSINIPIKAVEFAGKNCPGCGLYLADEEGVITHVLRAKLAGRSDRETLKFMFSPHKQHAAAAELSNNSTPAPDAEIGRNAAEMRQKSPDARRPADEPTSFMPVLPPYMPLPPAAPLAPPLANLPTAPQPVRVVTGPGSTLLYVQTSALVVLVATLLADGHLAKSGPLAGALRLLVLVWDYPAVAFGLTVGAFVTLVIPPLRRDVLRVLRLTIKASAVVLALLFTVTAFVAAVSLILATMRAA